MYLIIHGNFVESAHLISSAISTSDGDAVVDSQFPVIDLH